MRAIPGLQGTLTEVPDERRARHHSRPWHRLAAAFPDLAEMRVVDLGGRIETWRRASLHPAHVHVVNRGEDVDDLPEVTLLDRTEMELLSPESEIVAERLGGLTRSLTAVKRN